MDFNINSGWIYARYWTGSGDFSVTAELRLSEYGSNAAFEMGRSRNGIVFSDNDGHVVLKSDSESLRVLGETEELISDSYFSFSVVREGLKLDYYINDKKIAQCEIIEDYIENIGFYAPSGKLVINRFCMSGDIKSYENHYNWFYDDFDKESAGSYPKNWYTTYYWLEPGRNWIIESHGQGNVLRHRGLEKNSYTVLHGFGKNSTFEASFKINETNEKSGLWFALRHNLDPSYLVRCGYDIAKKSWIIEESYGEGFQLEVTKRKPLDLSIWHDIRLEAWGEAVVIYLDGEKVTNSNMLMNRNYGRAALYADNLDVSFDNIRYRSEGKVQSGVDTSILRGGTINLYDAGDGLTACKIERGWTYLSGDDLTWKRASENCPDMNCIRLNNGDLLSLKRHIYEDTKHVKYAAHISKDNGESWSQPYWLNDDAAFRIAMNGKLSEDKQGNIFFVCSSVVDMEGEDGAVYAEKIGGVEVYRSSDGGMNWKKIKRLDFDTTGLNLQEALVVCQSDGFYQLYARTPYGSIYTSKADSPELDFLDFESLGFSASMCAFNIWYDDDKGESYLWLDI